MASVISPSTGGSHCTIGLCVHPQMPRGRSCEPPEWFPTSHVRACWGTFSSPKKSPAASRRVTGSSVVKARGFAMAGGAVVETDVARAAEPKSCRSIPPAGGSAARRRHNSLRLALEMVPSGIWMFSGRMFT